MKKWLPIFLAITAVLWCWLYSGRQHPDRSTEVLARPIQSSGTVKHSAAPADSEGKSETLVWPTIDPGPIPTASAFKPAPAVAPNVVPLPPELSGIVPETVIENMRTTIRQYGTMFGGNPVGTNPEITGALQGQNPKGINFLKPDGNRVNDQGELVDAWGTPYFFHQLSRTEMEIRSAGPDRVMYTADDLVIK